MAMKTRSATRSPSGGTRGLTTGPSCAPGAAAATTARVGSSGIWPVTSLPTKPAVAASAVIASELPIVTRIGTPTTTRSSGTRRNAPPAPTRPAATPTPPETIAERPDLERRRQGEQERNHDDRAPDAEQPRHERAAEPERQQGQSERERHRVRAELSWPGTNAGSSSTPRDPRSGRPGPSSSAL